MRFGDSGDPLLDKLFLEFETGEALQTGLAGLLLMDFLDRGLADGGLRLKLLLDIIGLLLGILRGALAGVLRGLRLPLFCKRDLEEP